MQAISVSAESIENQELMLMLVVVMMAVKRKEAWGSGDDGDGDDGDGYDGDHRKALVMIILPMITITVKRSRAVRVCVVSYPTR